MSTDLPAKRTPDGLMAKAYDDLMHPSAADIGRAVHRAVRLALAPVDGVLWTVEQALEWVKNAAATRLARVQIPIERVQPPQLDILGPVVLGVQALGGEPTLSGLFANLLATAMDSDRAKLAHPAYARVIRDLLPDEARLLAALPQSPREVTLDIRLEHASGIWTFDSPDLALPSGCGFADLPAYLDNLHRLGLIRMESTDSVSQELALESFLRGRAGSYLEDSTVARRLVQTMISETAADEGDSGAEARRYVLVVRTIAVSDFGERFRQACGAINPEQTA